LVCGWNQLRSDSERGEDSFLRAITTSDLFTRFVIGVGYFGITEPAETKLIRTGIIVEVDLKEGKTNNGHTGPARTIVRRWINPV
jgi:hypothetical protein